MRRGYANITHIASIMWISLAIGVLVTSIIYVVLNESGFSKDLSTFITFIILCVIIIGGALFFSKFFLADTSKSSASPAKNPIIDTQQPFSDQFEENINGLEKQLQELKENQQKLMLEVVDVKLALQSTTENVHRENTRITQTKETVVQLIDLMGGFTKLPQLIETLEQQINRQEEGTQEIKTKLHEFEKRIPQNQTE